ncbi:hypothetical protein [Lonepinella koalarum]|uniref:hypothetical protein n=1 Tax=Lonepinella koalarum TaxID=53417 RepID=UPI003F6DB5CB
MTNYSLQPIFESLKPIFSKFNTLAASLLLVSPVAVNNNSYITQHQKQTMQADQVLPTVQRLELQQFIEQNIALFDTINPLIDLATSMVFAHQQVIADEEVNQLESMINEFNGLSEKLIATFKQQQIPTAIFEQKADLFSAKLARFCQMAKAVSYKVAFDEYILPRTYQGEESVGYRFDRNHTFEDFKRAMRG